MSIRKVLLYLLYSLPFVFVFIGALFQPNDPDLGWHLKYGQYFFDHLSILRANTFVTDMPGYQWVNLSWGTDLITYLLFRTGGFLALSLASSVVITATFYFFAKAWKLDFFEKVLIFPFLIFLQDSLISVSFRGQLLSILFLSILVFILKRYGDGSRKVLYSLPPLFLLWANIHGQFSIGLGILAIWLFSEIVQKIINKKEKKEIFQVMKMPGVVLIASILATLLNPFGIGIYLESLKYVGNPLLFAITEYLPPPVLSSVWWNQILVGFLLLGGLLIFLFDGSWKKRISDISFVSILYAASMMVKRYSWSMYYFTIPFLKPIASFIKPDKKSQINSMGGVIIMIAIVYVVILKMPFSQYANMSWDVFCRDYYACSAGGVKVLDGMKTGRLMNLYAWGGWLVWEHPEIETSIDGRMHLWKDEKGFSAYAQYYDFEQDVNSVDDSTYQTVYMSKDKPVYNRLKLLVEEKKWKQVFEDDLSGIFTRISN